MTSTAHIPLDTGWLDLDAGLLITPSGAEPLRPMETRLLRFLAERRGTPVPQDVLLAEVWGYSARARSRTVRSTVSRIRSRIEADPRNPRHLVTQVGEGYLLVPAESALGPRRSGLLGRDADLRSLRQALATRRVVVVVGPGGVGKTAVARVLAAGVSGSVWVDGQAARTPSALEAEAAVAVGTGGDAMLRALERKALLVVDDVERIPDVERILERWSQHAVRLLITSRRRLSIPAASTYELAPLETAAMSELLFATWSRGSLEREVDVSPLVEHLGGLPLAAELAAAWAPLTSPEELAARLDATPLSDPSRRDRHGSLDRVLHQSLQLLRQGELAALTVLATCPGGAAAQDAEQLIHPESLPSLLALRRHSLLQRELDQRGRERLDLLPPVRRHILRTQHTKPAVARQARHYGRLAIDTAARMRTPDDGTAWAWIMAETSNLRAAVRHSDLPDEERLALLQCLHWLGKELGPSALHREDLDQGARLVDPSAIGWLRVAEAAWMREQGELEAAIAAGCSAERNAGPWASFAAEQLSRSYTYAARPKQALAAVERAVASATDASELATALCGLGKQRRVAGAGAEAQRVLERAHGVAARAPVALLATIESDLGEHLADPTAGIALLTTALERQEAMGLERDRAVTLLRLGARRASPAQRVTELRAARDIARDLGFVRVGLHAALRIVQLAMETGSTEDPATLGDAIGDAEKLGDPNLLAALVLNRAHMAVDRDDFDSAERDYQHALALNEKIGMSLYAGMAWAMAGTGAAAAGDVPLALARLALAAQCWAEEPEGLVQVQMVQAILLDDVAHLPASGDEALVWARWALEGGAEPTEPSVTDNWYARQIQRGVLRPPRDPPDR